MDRTLLCDDDKKYMNKLNMDRALLHGNHNNTR